MFFLLSSVQYLRMQVDCFGVACNTLHYFAPRVRALLRGLAGGNGNGPGPGPPPPRFVSLPDVACAHLRALRRRRRAEGEGEGGGAADAAGKAGGKVVLLGSRQTMDTAPRAEGGLSSHVLK